MKSIAPYKDAAPVTAIYNTSSCTYWQSFCVFLYKLFLQWSVYHRFIILASVKVFYTHEKYSSKQGCSSSNCNGREVFPVLSMIKPHVGTPKRMKKDDIARHCPTDFSTNSIPSKSTNITAKRVI